MTSERFFHFIQCVKSKVGKVSGCCCKHE